MDFIWRGGVASIEMDYHHMSLAELKLVAKAHVPRIKKYYTMPKDELIQRLTLKVVPERFKVETMRIQELRDEAKLRGYTSSLWTMRRKDLVDLLYPGTQQHNKDYDGAQKHDDPEEGKGKDVWVEVLDDAR
jgi:hypothetical protein